MSCAVQDVGPTDRCRLLHPCRGDVGQGHVQPRPQEAGRRHGLPARLPGNRLLLLPRIRDILVRIPDPRIRASDQWIRIRVVGMGCLLAFQVIVFLLFTQCCGSATFWYGSGSADSILPNGSGSCFLHP
jgi:hypothetical protein